MRDRKDICDYYQLFGMDVAVILTRMGGTTLGPGGNAPLNFFFKTNIIIYMCINFSNFVL